MKRFIMYPFLFSLYPILFLYTHNISQVAFTDIITPTFTIIIFSVIYYLLFYLILKNKEKAALSITLLLGIFFSYGHFYNLMFGRSILGFYFGRHLYLLPFWTIVLLISIYIVINIKKDLSKLTFLLNIMSITLIMLLLSSVGFYVINKNYDYNYLIHNKQEQQGINLYKGEMPDIYYIILDGYASENTLYKHYGYDNSDFINHLKDNNFYVASHSHANYPPTYLSLASSLNMQHLDFLFETDGRNPYKYRIPYQMIEDNNVMSFLRNKGYKIVQFTSRWQGTSYNKYADYNISYGLRNEFLMILFDTSLFGPLIEGDYFTREEVLFTFSEIPKVNKQFEDPIFIFAHIIPPHPPYLFGQEGEPVLNKQVYPLKEKRWEDKESYLNQLIFINKKVVELVKNILLESERHPVIIIQSDHGPSSMGYKEIGGWNDPSVEFIKERMGILNAIYLPYHYIENPFYYNITPVNTFRIIFNEIFETQFVLLEDKSYFSYEYPYYIYIDVTNILHE